MPTVRTAKHLLLESTTKPLESGTYDVICQFCTVKGMVVESEVLKAQSCALSKLSLPVHSNVYLRLKKRKRLYFEKKLEFFEFFSFRKCRIVPKNVKGGNLWALLTNILLHNIKKLERGNLLRQRGIF